MPGDEGEFRPSEQTPFGGSEPTSGWAGSDTSKARATQADRDGTTAGRWNATQSAASEAGPFGITYPDLCEKYGWNHGQASGVLSTMHKAGRLSRLTTKRNKCKVYVLPDQVRDRETEPYGHVSTTDMLRDMYDLLNEADREQPRGIGRLSDAWHERANDVMRRYEGRAGDGR